MSHKCKNLKNKKDTKDGGDDTGKNNKTNTNIKNNYNTCNISMNNNDNLTWAVAYLTRTFRDCAMCQLKLRLPCTL